MKNLTIIQKKSVFFTIANLKLILSAGAYLIRGDYALDATHTLSPEENALLIVSTRRGQQADSPRTKIRHSLVICSQGGFFDDVKVWSGEDVKALQAAVEVLQNEKQNVTDQALSTQAKSIVGAINEIFGGGVKDKSIGASKLAQAVQDTLGKVEARVKVLSSGSDIKAVTEAGVYILSGLKNYLNIPNRLEHYNTAILIVSGDGSKINNGKTIIGFQSGSRYPFAATLRNNEWTETDLDAALEGKLNASAGSVKAANLQDDAVSESKIAPGAVTETKLAYGAVSEARLSARLQGKINGAAQKAVISKALEVIELTDNNKQNKAAIDARIAKLTELGVDLTNGYVISISYISGNKEYHGMVTAGKNSLLNGIVSDAQGGSYYGISVGATDGIVTFEETDPLVFKSEMSSAIDTLVECVEFTKTTLSNKAHLDAYLAKLPNAKVMCCTYNGGYAGTLHKINGSWYGVLVSESNTLAGQLSIKLQSDGTIVEGRA
jgi:hypothetical protein